MSFLGELTASTIVENRELTAFLAIQSKSLSRRRNSMPSWQNVPADEACARAGRVEPITISGKRCLINWLPKEQFFAVVLFLTRQPLVVVPFNQSWICCSAGL